MEERIVGALQRWAKWDESRSTRETNVVAWYGIVMQWVVRRGTRRKRDVRHRITGLVGPLARRSKRPIVQASPRVRMVRRW